MRVTTTTTRRNSGPLGGLFGSVIMVILGIIFIFASSFITKQNAALKERCTTQVQATVTGFARSESSEKGSSNSSSVTPVFEYDFNGKTYSSNASTYSSSFKDTFKVGSQYIIYVDPNDPMELYSEEISKSDGTILKILRWGGVGLIVFGIISFMISLAVVIAIGGAIGLALMELFKKKDQQS